MCLRNDVTLLETHFTILPIIGPKREDPITLAAMGKRAGNSPPFCFKMHLLVSSGSLGLKMDLISCLSLTSCLICFWGEGVVA